MTPTLDQAIRAALGAEPEQMDAGFDFEADLADVHDRARRIAGHSETWSSVSGT